MTSPRSLLAVAAALTLAACSGGDGGSDSILESGRNSGSDGDIADGAADGDASAADDPASTPAPPTTEVAADIQLLPCATELADGPTEIVFWHGMSGGNDTALQALADEYNESQSLVVVQLEAQGGYEDTIDKYLQSSQGSRPDMVMFPEYAVQQTIDTGSVIPAESCLESSGYDTSTFQPATLAAYNTGGLQWAMPFNVSNPVLYYNTKIFETAGLDPDAPPQTFGELREYAQAIVDANPGSYGIAIDSGADSGGGWFLEQWFANAGELYADNGNGRSAPPDEVLFNDATGVEIMTFFQEMVDDGLAFYVGDNSSGQDSFLKMADKEAPAAMAIGTSAALGQILAAVRGGLVPGLEGPDLGVGPLPGPSGTPTALVGGASLYVVADRSDEVTAAVWDFIEYLTSPEAQSKWAVDTGYVPIRDEALDLEPLATTYAEDPRFQVAYDQLVGSPDSAALQGPILGPQREVRVAVARAVAEIMIGGDAQTALDDAAATANSLLDAYNARSAGS